MFLEFWNGRQAEIAYEWDLLGSEDDEVRFLLVNQCILVNVHYLWQGENLA